MIPTRRAALGALFALTLPACTKKYAVGDEVLVEWEGADYPASIVAVEGSARYRVHFQGYDPMWDESVPLSRVRGRLREKVTNPPPPPAKVRARMAQGNKSQVSLFKLGDRVRVDWKGTVYPAVIVAVLGNERYRVHYEGYDANWDENVEVSRIQRR